MEIMEIATELTLSLKNSWGLVAPEFGRNRPARLVITSNFPLEFEGEVAPLTRVEPLDFGRPARVHWMAPSSRQEFNELLWKLQQEILEAGGRKTVDGRAVSEYKLDGEIKIAVRFDNGGDGMRG